MQRCGLASSCHDGWDTAAAIVVHHWPVESGRGAERLVPSSKFVEKVEPTPIYAVWEFFRMLSNGAAEPNAAPCLRCLLDFRFSVPAERHPFLFFHDDMFIDDNLARYVLLSTFDRSCICALVFIGHASPMKPVTATCLVFCVRTALARHWRAFAVAALPLAHC